MEVERRSGGSQINSETTSPSCRVTAERRWWRAPGTDKRTSSTTTGRWFDSSLMRTSTPSVQVGFLSKQQRHKTTRQLQAPLVLIAGQFTCKEGRNSPCLVYVSFSHKIYIYWKVELERMESTNLLRLLEEKPEFQSRLTALGVGEFYGFMLTGPSS